MSELFLLSPFSPFGVVAAQKRHLKHKHMIESLWCLRSIRDWLIVQSFHVIACTWFSRRKIGPEWLCCLHRRSFSLRRSQHCHSLLQRSNFASSFSVFLSFPFSTFLLLYRSWAAPCVEFLLLVSAVMMSPRPQVLEASIAVGQWQVASPTSITPSRGSNQGLCGARHQDNHSHCKGAEWSWHDSEVTRLAVAQVLWDSLGVRVHRIPNPWLKRWAWHGEKLGATCRWKPLSLSLSHVRSN